MRPMGIEEVFYTNFNSGISGFQNFKMPPFNIVLPLLRLYCPMTVYKPDTLKTLSYNSGRSI